jgi:TonB family protein
MKISTIEALIQGAGRAHAHTAAIRGPRLLPAALVAAALFLAYPGHSPAQGAHAAPRLITYVEPRYPFPAGGASGTVLVRFVIGVDGTTRDVTIVEASLPVFDEAALEAVKAWRYAPSLINGKPVEVPAQIRIHFAMPQ